MKSYFSKKYIFKKVLFPILPFNTYIYCHPHNIFKRFKGAIRRYDSISINIQAKIKIGFDKPI